MRPGLRINVGGWLAKDRFPPNWACVDQNEEAEYTCSVGDDPFPFQDNTVEAIYCSHMLEHVFPHKHPLVFKEFYRVLKPGAPIRIVVPDFSIAVKQYFEFPTRSGGIIQKVGHQIPPFSICHLMEWIQGYDLDKEGNIIPDHVTGFDWPLMEYKLKSAGFQNIVKLEYGKFNPIFFECDNPIHSGTSLYVEGQKGLR